MVDKCPLRAVVTVIFSIMSKFTTNNSGIYHTEYWLKGTHFIIIIYLGYSNSLNLCMQHNYYLFINIFLIWVLLDFFSLGNYYYYYYFERGREHAHGVGGAEGEGKREREP